MIEASEPDEGGDFVRFTCPGWRGYPVILSAGDLRESVFYGFPPAGDLPWESFGPFNGTGNTIEWRIETFGETGRSDRHHPSLVRQRSGGRHEEDRSAGGREGRSARRRATAARSAWWWRRAIPKANETARRIADE